MMQERFTQEMYAAAMERTIKRLWILCILLVVMLFGSNAAWLYYENQFADEVTTTQDVTQETEGGGDNTFVGGDYSYGETKSENNDN